MKKRQAPPAAGGEKGGNGSSDKKAKLNSGKASPKSSSNHAPAPHKPKSLVEALGKNKKMNVKKAFSTGGDGKQGKQQRQGKDGKDGKQKTHEGHKAPIDHKSLKPNFTLVRNRYSMRLKMISRLYSLLSSFSPGGRFEIYVEHCAHKSNSC